MPFSPWLRRLAQRLGLQASPTPPASAGHATLRVRLGFDALEARNLPADNFGPEGWEAGLLNMINRMRTDPQGELQYFLDNFSPLHSNDPYIQAALEQYNVSASALLEQWSHLTPVAPLAWSRNLRTAAELHNLQMIAHDQQSHQLPGELALAQRIEAAGYIPWGVLGENIFAFGQSIMHIHAAFAIDWGPGTNGLLDPPEHRNNIMDPDFKEVGVAVTFENDPNTQVGRWITTENFGSRTQITYSYILGNVYLDQNNNGRFDVGEGLNGITATLTNDVNPPWATPTDANGFYQFNVTPGEYTLTFTGWPLVEPIVKHIIVGADNIMTDIRITNELGNGGGNRAPGLQPGIAPALPNLQEDVKKPQGATVADLLGSGFLDPDANAQKGIAVFQASNDYGTWQFSVDQGNTWQDVGEVTATTGRLLRDVDWLRFIPHADYSGTASLDFRAWDRTTGQFGSLTDIHEIGGNTAYSLESASALVTVEAINDAPILHVALAPWLNPVASRSGAPAGSSVASLLGSAVDDVDEGDRQGIAVTGFASGAQGYWQFSLDGGHTWSNFGAVNSGKARLLRAEDWVRFVPRAGAAGKAGLLYRAWDQTMGIGGGIANVNYNGGMSAFSTAQATAKVSVNNAPILTTGTLPVLTTILEDTVNPAGDLVSRFASPLMRDGDLYQVKGIAVTGLTGTQDGTWQFSLNGGQTWSNFGDVSAERAILLRGRDKVRFVPDADFFGTVSLQFHAWDATQGTAGGSMNLTLAGAIGGGTAFSNAMTEAVLAIAPVNDSPVLDENGQPTLTPVDMNATNPKGDKVSKLLDLVYDADPYDQKGIAVIGLTGTQNGRWQYSLNDGRTWININSIGSSRALLLRDTDRIRFVPNRNFQGQASLMFRAWDRTSGTFGDAADLSLLQDVGGISAFSATTQSGIVDVG